MIDISCEYLEVNEIVESTQGINWQPPHNRKIFSSDLVYSPAQIMEHHRVELKDHDASEETRHWFEELKTKYPEVFSLNNEDIGHTQLVILIQVTIHQYVKNHTPSPSNITLGFSKKLRH